MHVGRPRESIELQEMKEVLYVGKLYIEEVESVKPEEVNWGRITLKRFLLGRNMMSFTY